jgi:hypothetical protein
MLHLACPAAAIARFLLICCCCCRLQDTKLIAEQLAGRRKKLAAEGLSPE